MTVHIDRLSEFFAECLILVLEARGAWTNYRPNKWVVLPTFQVSQLLWHPGYSVAKHPEERESRPVTPAYWVKLVTMRSCKSYIYIRPNHYDMISRHRLDEWQNPG